MASERALMVTVYGTDRSVEAEQLVVSVADDAATLTLDDGVVVVASYAELLAALSAAKHAREAA